MAAYDVSGRVALVTGAARNIGFETARLLHERGASVVLVDLEREPAEAAAARLGGERALGLAADVTDAEAMRAAVDTAVERFGGLDIVVANAGIGPPTATNRVVDVEAYERVIEVDLLGVWRTVRAGLDQVAQRGGHVVVVASVYAFVNGVLASPYAIAKAGVEQLGRALRVELAPHGASASVAYFGFIDTHMVRDSMEDDLGRRFEQTVPSFMLRRLPPSAAGEAIVHGIETRAPRIIAPRWWRVLSVLRGIVNPLFDARLERDRRVQELVRAADRPERAGARSAPPAGRA
jgi:NAD(P)-dependent dehydrogenase (short-subunit alcohol dehydrogenase family)